MMDVSDQVCLSHHPVRQQHQKGSLSLVKNLNISFVIACQHALASRAQYCYTISVCLSITLWYCV